RVFTELGMRSFGDYHDVYLKSDVLLLADVCQSFRKLCRDDAYGIEPFHRYTSPGVSWQAGLKMTGVRLELITDPEMHMLFEKGIRGGLCSAFKRLATANNPKVPHLYDPRLAHRWLAYWDANNQYGFAMSQLLPTHGFRWMTRAELDGLDIDGLDPEG